ncbi:hypothetical protein RJ640_009565 [Escallonia rubra]|uniref:F-box domain-containing protein n=1 Tax=Escallonia rubra TaxID=112253 RepID=A0AA88REN2_9ASTE|nr:hypothetical protein RJ640_009565 [Escallonia rubra]
MADFPLDILIDILSRLPAASLVRSKSVSRQWRSVISHDPHLLNLHHSRQSPHLIAFGPRGTILSVDHELSCRNPDEFTAVKKIHPPDFNLAAVGHPGSVNGLLLICNLSFKNSVFLWNPSINEFLEIGTPFGRTSFSIDGMCYDAVNDDYKVIVACAKNGECFYSVYSLKANLWSEMKGFDYGILLFGQNSGVNVNGNLHWIVSPDPSQIYNVNRVIVRYDLAEDRFEEVAAPDFSEHHKESPLLSMGLAVLKGLLCVYWHGKCEVSSSLCALKVYAMMEYGVRESWAELIVVPFVSVGVRPICFTSSGEVLLQNENGPLQVYNPKGRKIRNLHNDLRGISGLKATTYLETLISPGVSGNDENDIKTVEEEWKLGVQRALKAILVTEIVSEVR